MTLNQIKLRSDIFEKMTDEEFYTFCQMNQELRIERNNKHELIIDTPTGSLSSLINSKINAFLVNWESSRNLGIVFDSNGGFTLPDDSVKSPDASFMTHEKWNKLSPYEKERFAPACPEFVVELRSKSDDIQSIKNKMLEWIKNGVLLGFLIDPYAEKAYVYRGNGSIDVIEGFDKVLSGENILPGFELDLSKITIL